MAVECAYQTTESGFGHRKMWIFLTMIKKTYLDNSHTIEIEAEGLLILFLQSLFILRFQFNKNFRVFLFSAYKVYHFLPGSDPNVKHSSKTSDLLNL